MLRNDGSATCAINERFEAPSNRHTRVRDIVVARCPSDMARTEVDALQLASH